MDILPPDLVTYSNDAKTLLEDLQSRNERMFLLTFLVVNMAPTRRELDNDLFTVSGIVQKYNCTLKRLDFQQEDGFLSSLPLGHNGIEIKRGMTTSSTAIFVPFMTQELRMDGEAVYYGLNALSHNVIMANRKKLKNPNGLFLGVPGSGKSFAAKRELVNVFLATRDRIIVVDPMGEYSPLIKRLGGQVIEIAPDSPHHINPMDIDLSFDEENPMALKADFILSLMELIVGGKDGLQPVERTVIDRCVRQMYREHLQDPETSKMPTLQTLYDLLCSQPEGEAVRLATALEIYVSGSLNVFNHETNVDLKRAGRRIPAGHRSRRAPPRRPGVKRTSTRRRRPKRSAPGKSWERPGRSWIRSRRNGRRRSRRGLRRKLSGEPVQKHGSMSTTRSTKLSMKMWVWKEPISRNLWPRQEPGN